MTIVEKAAYLKGLTEGLGVDPESRDGKLWGALCELVSDMAHEIEDLQESNLDFAGACTRDVARCGAVVSEFAPNMSVPRLGFRLRNRITSGLAVATVVVARWEGELDRAKLNAALSGQAEEKVVLAAPVPAAE